MEWWIWVVVIGTAVFLVVDWFIVMCIKPRKWKGEERNDHDN